MKSRLSKSVLLPLAAGLVQILSGCMASTVNDPNSDKSAGGSDEIDTRIAVDRSGTPVVAARIALVRVDDSTGKPVALNATGPDGSFPLFVVPDGLYSVVLRDAGDRLGKFVDSIPVKNQKLPPGRDTLLPLGSVRGVVRVSAGHSPATVSVGLLGTDIMANVKPDGTFRIELVPGGIYTLGAFPILEGYGPLYKRIQLKDGQNLALPDTLVMPFTGLPAPGALRVLQDTGTGNVRVSWNRVDHPDLLGYVLERVERGAVTTSRYLTDTTWTDSLGANWEAMPLLGPWPSREVAYRVRSRSLEGSPDSKGVANTITAKPPEWTKRVDSTQLVLLQDSLTGDVRLHWHPVRHPHLSGYLVERLESGVTTSLGVRKDTSLVDSMGKDWNALPLLGPWPPRNVSYRIRLLADNVATDAVTAATSILARPPEWTKHVDSVKVAMQTDPVSDVTTLRWNTPTHPDLEGWMVTRMVNGIQDCSRRVEGGTWNDAGCPNPVDKIVDSSRGTIFAFRTHVHQRQSADLSYTIEAIRKRGSSGKVATTTRRDSVASVVEWRDSILDPSKEVGGVDVIGGWQMIRYAFGGGISISRDGAHWESLPDTAGEYFAASGDSLWGLRPVDNATWALTLRTGPGRWSSERIAIPQGVCSENARSMGKSVDGFYVDFGDPVIECYFSTELWKWRNGKLEPYRGYPYREWASKTIDRVWSDSNGLSKIGISYYGMASIYARSPGESQFTLINEVMPSFDYDASPDVLGELSTGVLMFTYYLRTRERTVLAKGKSKDAYHISNPPGVSNMWDVAIWKDEIWTVANGRLWKGKLHLPSETKTEKP